MSVIVTISDLYDYLSNVPVDSSFDVMAYFGKPSDLGTFLDPESTDYDGTYKTSYVMAINNADTSPTSTSRPST